MPHFFYTTIALLICFQALCAQSFYKTNPISIAEGAIGSTTNNVWSNMTNPSGIANSSNYQLGASYTIPYAINELSSQNISLILPTSLGHLGGYYHKFGAHSYNEQTLGISYAKSFSPILSLGFSINYIQYQVSSNNNKGTPYSSIGMQINPLHDFTLGLSLINPENTQLEMNSESIFLPSIYTFGIKWHNSDNLSLSYEFEKEQQHTSISKVGISYTHHNYLWIRAGILGQPMIYSLGLGIKLNAIVIDAGFATHPELGNTSSIGLTFKPEARK